MNYHYVYKITIIETGQYYIGVRSCNVVPEADPYLGSGTIITAFHRKLPKSAFKKEILQTFSNREEANAYEKYLISLEDLTSAMVLNCFGRKRKQKKPKALKQKKPKALKQKKPKANSKFPNQNLNTHIHEEFNRDGTRYNKLSMMGKYYSIRSAISNGMKVPKEILDELNSLSLYEMVQREWWKRFTWSGKYCPDGYKRVGRPIKKRKLAKAQKNKLAYFKKKFTSGKLKLTNAQKLKVQLALDKKGIEAYDALVKLGVI